MFTGLVASFGVLLGLTADDITSQRVEGIGDGCRRRLLLAVLTIDHKKLHCLCDLVEA
jgi:hypothetical protein